MVGHALQDQQSINYWLTVMRSVSSEQLLLGFMMLVGKQSNEPKESMGEFAPGKVQK